MKILITGNAGMIGSTLADFFLKLGYPVVGIDNLSGGFLRNVSKAVKFYKTDITNQFEINTIFGTEKPDFVIHCAAYAAEILSPFIRNYNYTNNLVGSANIINACINNDVKKIINFSSIATYGEGYRPFKEDDIRNPKDCYGIAKLAVEMDLKEAYEHFGLNYSTVIPHNVLSHRQNYFDKYRNVIAIFVRQAFLGLPITIYGDGLQTRSFSDTKYLCKPIWKLLFEHNDDRFNLGSDYQYTIKDAANIVLDAGRSLGYCKSEIQFLEPRREVKHAHCDHTKAKELLGFEDKTDLQELVLSMFSYIKDIPVEEPKKMEYEITKNMYSYWK